MLRRKFYYPVALLAPYYLPIGCTLKSRQSKSPEENFETQMLEQFWAYSDNDNKPKNRKNRKKKISRCLRKIGGKV